MAGSQVPAINVQMPESAMQTAMNGVFMLGAAAGSYFLLKKLIEDARRNNVLDDLNNPGSVDGIAANIAAQLYSGMITQEWMNDTIGDGTNLDVMYEAAKKIYSYRQYLGFSDISRKYKALYQRDLLQDIEGDLNAEEKAKFMSLMSSGLGAIPAMPKMVVSAAPSYVVDSNRKVIQHVPAYTLLGAHVDTYIFADNSQYHAFIHNGNLRLIDSRTSHLNSL